MNSKKLICFDVDGTLLNHKDFKITPSSKEGIKHLKAAGHIIVIASGRDMDHIFSQKYVYEIEPDAIVHSNGQKVTVGNQKIFENFLDRDLIKELIEFAKANDICIGFNIGEKGCYVNKQKIIEMEKEIFGSCNREFIDESELLNYPLYSLNFNGTPEDAKRIEDNFPILRLPVFANQKGADILYKNVSKADGIEMLLKYYNMKPEDVIAFGDSMNDIEMIVQAGIGVAMGNAIDELKKKADFITKPIDEDGIIYALKKLKLVS